jgi:hypothetical protein
VGGAGCQRLGQERREYPRRHPAVGRAAQQSGGEYDGEESAVGTARLACEEKLEQHLGERIIQPQVCDQPVRDGGDGDRAAVRIGEKLGPAARTEAALREPLQLLQALVCVLQPATDLGHLSAAIVARAPQKHNRCYSWLRLACAPPL